MAIQASKLISLTVLANGSTLKLSADKIVRFTASGSNTILTYVTERDRPMTKLVTQDVATINTAAVRTQALTLDDADSTVIYFHSDKIIFVDDNQTTTGNRGLVYWNPAKPAPEVYAVTEAAAAINTAAQNTVAITIQQSGVIRYINNLFIEQVNPESVLSAPVITFTTKLRSGPATAALVAGTGYTNPTVAITGGGGSGATATLSTKVITATVVAGGTGGTPGAVTITGTTGTGTKFQATGTINGGGVLTGALTVTVVGNYTVPVTSIAAEPVTGGSLTGTTVALSLGILELVFVSAGTGYTSYPSFVITDATGINGSVTRAMTVQSPLTIADGGTEVNTNPTLTFSTGTVTATATATASGGTVVSTSLTQAGSYTNGTSAYPTLTISGGLGAQILYDTKRTGFIKLQVAETAATIQTAVNAL